MSGLGRTLAGLELRSARAMSAAQAHYDNLSPPEPDDDDLLTDDQALEQARAETLSAGASVADALAKLCDVPAGWEPVDVFALCGSGDPVDAVDVATLQLHQLLAIVMTGEDKATMRALRELRDRLARELRDDIRGRADDLLAAQQADIDDSRDEWLMDRIREVA